VDNDAADQSLLALCFVDCVLRGMYAKAKEVGNC